VPVRVRVARFLECSRRLWHERYRHRRQRVDAVWLGSNLGYYDRGLRHRDLGCEQAAPSVRSLASEGGAVGISLALQHLMTMKGFYARCFNYADNLLRRWSRVGRVGVALLSVFSVSANPAITVRQRNIGNSTIDVRFTNPSYCYNCGGAGHEFDSGSNNTMSGNTTLEKFLGSQIWRQGDTVKVWWRYSGLSPAMDWIEAGGYSVPATESDVYLPSGSTWVDMGVDTYSYWCVNIYNQTGKPETYWLAAVKSCTDTVIAPEVDTITLAPNEFHQFVFTLPGLTVWPTTNCGVSMRIQTDIESPVPLYLTIAPGDINAHGNAEQNVVCDEVVHGFFAWNNTNSAPQGSIAPPLPNLTNQNGLIYGTNWSGGSEVVKEATFKRGTEALYGAALTLGQAQLDQQRLLQDTNWQRMLTELEKMRTNSAANGIAQTNTDSNLTNIANKLLAATNQLAFLTNMFGNQSTGVTGLSTNLFSGMSATFSNTFSAEASRVAGMETEGSYGDISSSPWVLTVTPGHTMDVNPMHVTGIATIASWTRGFFIWLFAFLYWWYSFKRIQWYFGTMMTIPKMGVDAGSVASLGATRIISMGILAAVVTACVTAYANSFSYGSANTAMLVNPFKGVTGSMGESLKLLNYFVPLDVGWRYLVGTVAFEGSMFVAWGVGWMIVKLLLTLVLVSWVSSAQILVIKNDSPYGVAVWQDYAGGGAPASLRGLYTPPGGTTTLDTRIGDGFWINGYDESNDLWITWSDRAHDYTNRNVFGNFSWAALGLTNGGRFDTLTLHMLGNSGTGPEMVPEVTTSAYHSFEYGWNLGLGLFGAGLAFYVLRRLTRPSSGDI